MSSFTGAGAGRHRGDHQPAGGDRQRGGGCGGRPGQGQPHSSRPTRVS